MAEKGNGDDKSVKDAKKQMAFLDEVKALAKKHGVQVGGMPGAGIDPTQQKRDLRVEVSEQGGQVIVNFKQSISWMALSPPEATKFAASIIKIVQNIQSIKAIGGEALESETPAEKPAEDPDDKKSEVDKPE
jgi:hypothetical protein